MKVLAGLGNPGPEYRDTRHNAGFRVLDVLAAREGAAWREHRDRHEAVITRGPLSLCLLKPMTFMNLSGPPVRTCLGFRECPPSDCLVVVDDMALPLGSLRLRGEGGSGGHHGLDSLIEALGTSAFPRLRVGIGAAPGDGASHVLGRFAPEERPVLEETLSRAADAALCWAREGLDAAMNRFNPSQTTR